MTLDTQGETMTPEDLGTQLRPPLTPSLAKLPRLGSCCSLDGRVHLVGDSGCLAAGSDQSLCSSLLAPEGGRGSSHSPGEDTEARDTDQPWPEC